MICHECDGTGIFDKVGHSEIPCAVCNGTGELAGWNDTGLDEARAFSESNLRPVIAISDGVIGCWRELDENESPHAAIRSYVDSYEGEWDELCVWVYEGGKTEGAMVVRPDSAILNTGDPDDDFDA